MGGVKWASQKRILTIGRTKKGIYYVKKDLGLAKKG